MRHSCANAAVPEQAKQISRARFARRGQRLSATECSTAPAKADKDGHASGSTGRKGAKPFTVTNQNGAEGVDFGEFLVAREGGLLISCFEKYHA